MMKSPAVLFFVLFSCGSLHRSTATPIVVYHGMGDSCCEYGSLWSIIKLMNETLGGVEIVSLQFGSNFLEDMESGFFLNANKQVEIGCKTIADNPALQNGYHGVGFSQGGQFLRAIAQRCPNPPMKKLISLGGQHQGVYGLPRCGGQTPGGLCNDIRHLLDSAAYLSIVQKSLVQAQYWHDPLNEELYRNYSTFIAEINNERIINESYIRNLQNLEKLVLVEFSEDSMVVPRESSWFGFYKAGTDNVIVPYNQTRVYTEDLLGLQQMVANGQIDFLSTEGNHLQFTKQWFLEEIVNKYLKD